MKWRSIGSSRSGSCPSLGNEGAAPTSSRSFRSSREGRRPSPSAQPSPSRHRDESRWRRFVDVLHVDVIGGVDAAVTAGPERARCRMAGCSRRSRLARAVTLAETVTVPPLLGATSTGRVARQPEVPRVLLRAGVIAGAAAADVAGVALGADVGRVARPGQVIGVVVVAVVATPGGATCSPSRTAGSRRWRRRRKNRACRPRRRADRRSRARRRELALRQGSAARGWLLGPAAEIVGAAVARARGAVGHAHRRRG